MRRSAQVLDEVRSLGRAALIVYLPVGFPDVATSIAAMQAAVAGGADVIEVGIPYSDPLLDGPVIQHAVDAALRGGVRTKDVFTALRELGGGGSANVVMTYWNLVDHYGVQQFADELAAAGGSGIITPDLIPDEAASWIAASDRHDLERIFLVAPSSSDQRLRKVIAAGSGWVYAASTMGVTGVRAEVSAGAHRLVSRTRQAGAQRVCVGLGVSTPQQAAQVATYADGVVVGSAVVHALAGAALPQHGVAAVGELVRKLAASIAAVDPKSRDVGPSAQHSACEPG